MEKLIMKVGEIVETRTRHQSVKVTGSTETWRINAYAEHLKNNEGKTISWKYSGSEFLDCFVEDDKGVEKARKAYGLTALKTENRQRKQDVRNNIASGRAALAGVKELEKTLEKSNPELLGWMLKVEKQKEAGEKVDMELVKKIQAHFDSMK